MKRQPAREILWQLSDLLRENSFKRRVVYEDYTSEGYERVDTGLEASAVSMNYVNIDLVCLPEFSNRACLFILREIMPQLKYYNLLWHKEVTTNGAENRIMKELRDKHFIFTTEVIGIYIVNPLKLWKGAMNGAVEATKKLILEHGRPSVELIKDLKPPRKVAISSAERSYNLMNKLANGTDGKHLNILEEPDAPYGE